jgi:ribosomal protein L15
MQIHEIQRKTANRDRRYVGRGGKRGKTSGRGTKGQNSRAGRKIRPVIRDLIKKLPKNRGYKFKSIRKPVMAERATKDETYAQMRKRLKLVGGKITIK